MGRKAKHPEHENLERWMVSYADFVTLLFATFVVLYALSQVDAKDFAELEKSIQAAFSAPSIMQGSEGMLNASNSLFDESSANSVIEPLMMEYVSQKYEEQSMQDIEKNIDKEVKSGGLSGVETIETDQGLIIRFKDDFLFASGSAQLTPSAKKKVDKVGAIIAKKFILHCMRIEGHTDNQAFSSKVYPSNWELSSARACTIIRYFIQRFSFIPSIFTSVGYGDTRPIANNAYANGRAKNRRIEIYILKKKYSALENPQNDIMKMSKEQQKQMQAKRIETINKVLSEDKSQDSKTSQDSQSSNGAPADSNANVLNKVYQKEVNRLDKETNAYDNAMKQRITGQGKWLKPPAHQRPEKLWK